MNTLWKTISKYALLGGLGLTLATTMQAATVNIDFQGVRNVPGPDELGPVFVGVGAGGGGTSWNGLLADSRLADGTDDDNLTVSGTNLVDDSGASTVVSFTVSPVGGDVCCSAATTVPMDPLALFNDYIFNNSAGNHPAVDGYPAGESPFTIAGLGGNATVDLYFYRRSGVITIEGAVSSEFSGDAPFTPANTTYFKDVPVTGGKVTGTMGGGVAVLWGVSINASRAFGTPTAPTVKSTAPTGPGIRTNAVIKVELQDSATRVVLDSIKLFLNGQAVASTANRVAEVTTVIYDPKGSLAAETTNTVKIVFSSDAVPAVTKTNEFSFVTVTDEKAALVINVDFNGLRPGDSAGPTYIGQGAGQGATTWNGLAADSTGGDDNLTVAGANLVNSIGTATTAAYTISPVGGDNNGAGTDPNATAALYSDYVFVYSAGQSSPANFTLSGLGTVPVVDLFFYFGANGDFDVTGAVASPFTAGGIFTPNNTRYFHNVPVNGGAITGTVGKGAVAVFHGFSVRKPAPAPFVLSTAPSGSGVLSKSEIVVQLRDYVSQVKPDSIQLSLNGQAVTPTSIAKEGGNLTVIRYHPPKPMAEGVNTVKVAFSDTASPSLAQTSEFSFGVISEVRAANIVNIDFNGSRIGDVPGPTYSGQGAAGGGLTWNGIAADSRILSGPDEGLNDDNLTVGRDNLVNSLGIATTIDFTVSPMGGDVGGAPATDPTATGALYSDYIFNKSAGNLTDLSPFTITGLGNAPFVDLYFYKANGGVTIEGVKASAFIPVGIFTSANTFYFKTVPVTGGTVSGNLGPGTAVINGMSIVTPLPQPFVKSTTPVGAGVKPNTAVVVELQDYATQVSRNSIQMLFNGQAVSPNISKPAGSSVTTLTYQPGALAPDSSNVVTVTFSDDAATPVTQTTQFSFVMFNEAMQAKIVNIDFNGVRNVPGPDEPGPTYSGLSAPGGPGGGTVWNGITADSRRTGETPPDDDNLTVSGSNLLNGLGAATTVSFTVGPMGGDVGGAPTTDPTATAALYSDYIFNNSAGNTTALSPFKISGLTTPLVDLYFYRGNGGLSVNGATATTFASTGIFTAGNTIYYKNVPVVDGNVTGNLGPGTAVVHGLSIVLVTPQTSPLSIGRSGSDLVISWTGSGTFQRADDATGPWTDVPGATSPRTVTPADARKFYRLRQ